jgi:type II secretory ATPase GspE/PulE/Tfp pilus assembly ATPase PilB-like protein
MTEPESYDDLLPVEEAQLAEDAEPLAFTPQGRVPEAIVQELIEYAARLGVSDLFFVTNENHVAVLVRHLGVLRPITQLHPDTGKRCMAHIKAGAGLDIAEKRRPLDGRWIMERDGQPTLDLRIGTLPTLYGEDFTLRLLDRSTRLVQLDNLGLHRRDFNQMLSMLNSSSGLILVTGPTGSGKTTTLYACLHQLNNGQRKLNTIEDPVEYAVEGIRQSQVNTRIDVGFAELLRSVLRQAPDVIMIGEIRDPETAETAVRAANSGHLVLATLHAPIAAAAVPAMLNLGVHPHFLASSLLGVISQRLVRTLCQHCKTSFDIADAPETFDEIRSYLAPGEGEKLYGPSSGCAKCNHLGFAGRSGVFEVMVMTPALRRLIVERVPTQTLRAKAIEEGLVEFRKSALLKVAQGQTSIEELFRAIPTEYLSIDT